MSATPQTVSPRPLLDRVVAAWRTMTRLGGSTPSTIPAPLGSSAEPARPEPTATEMRAPRTLLDRSVGWWRTSVVTLWGVVAAMALFELLVLNHSLSGNPDISIGSWTLLCILAVLTLLGRRRWPLAAVIATGLASAVTDLWGPRSILALPPLVALYSLFVIAGTLQRVIGLLVITACWILPAVLTGSSPLVEVVAPDVFFLAAAVTAASISRSRREALEHGDAQFAAHTAEQRLTAQRDAARSQARVAAELHDSVGHDLTAILSLSEGLAGITGDAELDEAITAINALARDGLADTRHAVDALQPAAAEPGRRTPAEQPPAALGPAGALHGWDDLAGVLGTTRRTGLAVALAETGPRPEDPVIADTVFTVVREALTNVMRHAAGATRIVLALDHDDSATRITVSDDGANTQDVGAQRRPVPPPGNGLSHLADMLRERGGVLSAGPIPGGWSLRAVIPLQPFGKNL